MTQNERYRVYLAALLHDIGKFYQRADEGHSKKSDFLLPEVKNLEDQICPLHASQNYRTHKHVLWTAQFFVDHESTFREVFPPQPGEQSLLQLAAAHHYPSTELEKLIQKADWLSSGVDRTKDEGDKDAEEEHKWDDFKKIRMRSVMEMAGRDETSVRSNLTHYLPVNILGKSWPEKTTSQPPGKNLYADLWTQFEAEFRKLSPKEPLSFLESLRALLEKYTSYIPSSTVHLPDVSLYDHLKTTAALALCLYDFQHSEDATNPEKPFVLVGADLSGIQSYIYDIISKHAAKNLKGRSFYLQLLADSVLYRICDELELPTANVIYASGGGFFLLAPHTEKTTGTIRRLEAELADFLWEETSDTLFMALAENAFSEKDLLENRLGTVWAETIEKLSQKKRNRYAQRLVSNYAQIFMPVEVGGGSERDVITGEEIARGRKIQTLDLREGSTGDKILQTTYQQIELGKNLKNADFWILSPQPLKYWQKEKITEVECLGVWHYLLSREKLDELTERHRGSVDGVQVRSINRTDLDFVNIIPGARNSYGYTFYGGNKYPEDEYGEPKTFNELAGRTENREEEGFTRLGILRMDVDNLGKIFRTGFAENRRTFSRYSTLSRGLDFFFKGFLNEIWADKTLDLRDHTQILYAGGDDLFIVGKWTACITFAEKIREKFRAYVCGNPELSLSGGLAIVPVMFPVSMGAELAAEAEKAAKGHTFQKGNQTWDKNAFSLLGEALNGDYEYPLVKQLKDKLKNWVDGQGLSRSLLGKIYAHYYGYQEQRKHGKSEAWRWTMAYDFGRSAQTPGTH
ncbi:MAG: type III-A CRISPR-associated protein Cas10/Csm1 [Bacteroidia bacterium]|nr:type III-A CRISPR-associated protein Cas10/Csm1 [Bacteroidia bacterium]